MCKSCKSIFLICKRNLQVLNWNFLLRNLNNFWTLDWESLVNFNSTKLRLRLFWGPTIFSSSWHQSNPWYATQQRFLGLLFNPLYGDPNNFRRLFLNQNLFCFWLALIFYWPDMDFRCSTCPNNILKWSAFFKSALDPSFAKHFGNLSVNMISLNFLSNHILRINNILESLSKQWFLFWCLFRDTQWVILRNRFFKLVKLFIHFIN